MAIEQRRCIGDDVAVYRASFDTTAVSTDIVTNTLIKIATKSNRIITTLSEELTSDDISTIVTVNGTTYATVTTTWTTNHDTTILAHISALNLAQTTYTCVDDTSNLKFVITGTSGLETITATTTTTGSATASYTSGSIFGELIVGDYYIHKKGSSIPVVLGDTYYPLASSTYNRMADITSATVDISVDKIDTTTGADAFKVARSGKSDLTGTIEFVYIKGITDDTSTGLLDAFFRVASVDASGVATVVGKRGLPYIIAMWLDSTDEISGNHQLLLVLTVEFESFTLGGSMGNAQTTSAPFHIVGGFTPTIYKVING